MLNDFTPSGVSQLNLFDEDQPRAQSDELMKVLDRINHSGKGKIWFAGRGIAPEWQMKRDMLSPAYTTRWSDILLHYCEIVSQRIPISNPLDICKAPLKHPSDI
ncbi:DNA polymerase V subunit UmuC [Salmonella enterica]|uniref:DNA polymerase V subunit UmuC n=1 Tax=Salmonella enterica TaxID=28901 RepID=A0A379SI43_SALER|nr:DNA polymerase V subunit UmuC [Salmonella enterica]